MNASTTRSLPPDRQFDRYLVTMCSLMLMVVLAVGATGYAGIQGLLSSTNAAATAAPVESIESRSASRSHRHAGCNRARTDRSFPRVRYGSRRKSASVPD